MVLSMLTPFADGRHTLKIGLQPLDPADWILPDARFAEVLALKARLHGERLHEVFDALPESLPAQAEVLALLGAHLPQRFPETYRRDGAGIRVRPHGGRVALGPAATPALLRAGELVQEDLCLMQPGPQGYRLTAASLCSPSVWRLAEKLGQPLDLIHATVPGYAAQLAPRVNRIFDNLKPDLPVWRTNWSLPTAPDFFLPDSHGAGGEDITPGTAGERVFLRTERQTLRRLPETAAILFTIKTEIHPAAALAGEPALAGALARAVRSMPPEMLDYKAIGPFREALLGYLDSLSLG